MPRLDEILTAPEVRPRVVARCTRLIDAEVERKGGLSGVAIKTAYKLVQRIKPDMVREVTDKLLPEFAAAMDPLYQASVSEAGEDAGRVGELFARRLEREPGHAADALLGVTDAKIDGARPAIKKAYATLRGSARTHVQSAVPGLGRVVAEWV